MLHIQAPNVCLKMRTPSVFLSGGITSCPNWQSQVVDLLADTDLVLLNPRRDSFPMDDPTAAWEQVGWEYDHLRRATAILFWFPAESLCPIALYELGAWSMTDKPLFVGVHPDYARRRDVEMQTTLVRWDITVVNALDVLTHMVKRRLT